MRWFMIIFSHLTEAERLSPDNLFVYKTYAPFDSDSITRFWVTHREAFDASVKPEMEKALAALYKTDICEYLSGATVYDAAAYETLKKETSALGFNVSKQYDPCFRLIECHACGDMEAYLALCKEEYPKMEDDVRNAWLNGFGRLFEGAGQVCPSEGIEVPSKPLARYGSLRVDVYPFPNHVAGR